MSRLVDIVPATSSPEQHPLGKSKSGRLGVPSSFTENPIWFFLQMGGPLNHPFFGGIFPCKPSSYWGTPMTMEIFPPRFDDHTYALALQSLSDHVEFNIMQKLFEGTDFFLVGDEIGCTSRKSQADEAFHNVAGKYYGVEFVVPDRQDSNNMPCNDTICRSLWSTITCSTVCPEETSRVS